MTKSDVERIIEEEMLISEYNLIENRPDRENEIVVKMEDDHFIVYQTDEHAQMIGNPVRIIREEDAFERFLSKLRAIKTKQYERLFSSKGANRVLRETITKTFVSRYDFEATYHELYKSEDGKYFSVLRIDPAPGGCGEEFMYIKEAYSLDTNVKGQSYSDEELLQLVFSEGEKVKLTNE